MVFWIIGILVVLYFLGSSIKPSPTLPHFESSLKNSPRRIRSSEVEKLFYKVREVRKFEMMGIYYRNLPKSEEGQFIGFVQAEENPHDKYAVAVYKDNHLHIGYVPRGRKRLSDSLHEWHSGKVFAWGRLRYNKEIDRWSGVVYVPLGLSDEEIEIIKESKLRGEDYFRY